MAIDPDYKERMSVDALQVTDATLDELLFAFGDEQVGEMAAAGQLTAGQRRAWLKTQPTAVFGEPVPE